ncbi:MAG TPA: hypothetical protein VIV88_00470 [Gemmatimonadales bacterium]
MSFQLRIDGPDYRRKLKQDTGTVRAMLRDTLRAVLRDNFGFLAWGDGQSSPTDTVTLTVYQPTTTGDACLRLTVRGEVASADTAACRLDFEKWEEIVDRTDWKPQQLRLEWTEKLTKILATKRDELVDDPLGLLPLHAQVDLSLKQDLKAHLSIQPSDIRASDIGKSPEFRLHASIQDDSATIPSVDTHAELWLRGCGLHPVDHGYVCQISTVVYLGDTLPATKEAEVLGRARVTLGTLHLRRGYRPATLDVGGNGTVTPEGKPR